MVERGVKREQQGEGDLFLPPGFRFHPTDEEVITSYLLQKLLNPSFSPRAMGEVNLNKCEPWDLPSKAKMGEKEWYFFCHKDMKYPTGMRTNRATEKGYWKATGKDREIFKPASSASAGSRELVGMKKTLVFYMGRAPRGSKTNWVMHEFRLEGKYGRDGNSNANLRLRPKDEWVVCKVFHKNNNGEADHKKADGGAAAAAEYSSGVGTPNVSSISVDATADVDGLDDGFIDSMIGDPAHFNSATNLPDFSTTTSNMNAGTAAATPYNAATTAGSFVDLPSYTFADHTTTGRNMNQAQGAVAANSTAAPYPASSSSYDVSSLFSWNLPAHAAGQNPMGSSSFNLHDQLAMMTRALGGGGGVSPNFAAGLPTTGIPQHSSPLGHGSYATNYYYSSASSGAAADGAGTGQISAKNLGA